MKFYFIAVVSLVFLFANSSILAQPVAIEPKSPVMVRDILETFKAPSSPHDPAKYENLNNNAIKMIQGHCDMGFVDDGTNYWVLRTAGANEALMREVERCTSTQRRREALEKTNKADELSVYMAKKILMSDLIRFLFPFKDIVGRKRTILACKEYILRYGEDHRLAIRELTSCSNGSRRLCRKWRQLSATWSRPASSNFPRIHWAAEYLT